MPPSALRDRKRERTRRALQEAAVELFEARGYEATTVADIAAAAEVGTRTFFNYFASKEELLFPEPDERVQSAVQAIATRKPGERPVEVLLRALRAAGDSPGEHLGDNLAARISVLRARVSRTVPAVSGRAAYAQLASQQEIARQLRAAFPEELDDVGAAALVGAVVGAVSGALTVLFQKPGLEDGEQLHRLIGETTSKVLAPWLSDTPAGEAARAPEAVRAPEPVRAPEALRAPEPMRTLEAVRPLEAVREPDAVGTSDAVRTFEAVRSPSAARTSEAARTPDGARVPDAPRTPEAIRAAMQRTTFDTMRTLPNERLSVERPHRTEDDAPRREATWYAPDAARRGIGDDLPRAENALV